MLQRVLKVTAIFLGITFLSLFSYRVGYIEGLSAIKSYTQCSCMAELYKTLAIPAYLTQAQKILFMEEFKQKCPDTYFQIFSPKNPT